MSHLRKTLFLSLLGLAIGMPCSAQSSKCSGQWVGPTALKDNNLNGISISYMKCNTHLGEVWVSVANRYKVKAYIYGHASIQNLTNGRSRHNLPVVKYLDPLESKVYAITSLEIGGSSENDWLNGVHDSWGSVRLRLSIDDYRIDLDSRDGSGLSQIYPINQREKQRLETERLQKEEAQRKQREEQQRRQQELARQQQQEAQRQKDEQQKRDLQKSQDDQRAKNLQDQQRQQAELARQQQAAAAARAQAARDAQLDEQHQKLQNQLEAQQIAQEKFDAANRRFSDQIDAIGQESSDRIASLREQFGALPEAPNAEVAGLRQKLLDKLIEAENEAGDSKRADAEGDLMVKSGSAAAETGDDAGAIAGLVGLIAGVNKGSQASDHATKAQVARQEAGLLRTKLRQAEDRAYRVPTAGDSTSVQDQDHLIQSLRFDLLDMVKGYAKPISEETAQSEAKVGATAMMMQDYTNASAAFSRWLEANPQNDKYEPLRALSLVLGGDPNGGLELLSKLRGSTNPQTAQTARDIMAKLEEKGLQRPTASQANEFASQGSVYAAASSWVESEQAYRKAVEVDPSEPRWHREVAGALAKQKKWVDAAQEYKEAVRLDATDAKTYANLGACLLQTKQYADSVAAYTEAVRLEPTNAGYFDNLGTAYWCAGDLAKAVTNYTEAVRLAPSEQKYQDHLKKVQEAQQTH